MPKHEVKTSKNKLAGVPGYLAELIFKVADTEGNASEYVIRTPSSQFWSSLSTRQKERWREIVTLSGEDPEDYLQEMRAMLPADPPGIPKPNQKL